MVAVLLAALLGPFIDDWIEAKLFRPGSVLAAVLAGGIWMIWLGRSHARQAAEGPDLDHSG